MTGSRGDAAGAAGGVRGRRLVVGLYAGVVAFAGVAGALFATVVDDPEPPAYLFVVTFPATPAGFALYGALTVATLLGIPLALVVYVSRSGAAGSGPGAEPESEPGAGSGSGSGAGEGPSQKD